MIACSGYLDEKIQQKIEECGFDDFFIAPLNRQNISQIILPLIEIRKQKRKNQVYLKSLISKNAYVDNISRSGNNFSLQNNKKPVI